MYSKLKPFSFMGVSNSEMFLSEKDPNSSSTTTTMEISFLVRRHPPLEFQEEDHDHQCQIAPFQDDYHEPEQQQQEEEEEEEDECQLMMIKMPSSSGEFKVHENDDDGFKTPTSSDHKIPAILKCPPAPRKPKSHPISAKRKAFGRRILLDLTKEVESLFPPALIADLGNKIKKVRQGSDFK